MQMAGPVALDLRGRVGERFHAQRIGQPPRRVDGHDAGAPPGPGRRQREGGRHRRLADAARAAADHDRALGHQLGQGPHGSPGRCPDCLVVRRTLPRSCSRRPSATSVVTASASAAARTRSGPGRWRPRRAPAPGGGAGEGPGVVARSVRPRRRGGPAGRTGPPRARPDARGATVRPAAAATSAAGRSSPTGSGSQALTMTGPSWTPALSSRV